MKVAVVSEHYPRRADPVLGVWAHRQALAARDAGAEVRVLVLHRFVPPLSSLRAGPRAAAAALAGRVRQPWREDRDGLEVIYVPFVSPPRWRAYGTWGAWAAPSLAPVLARLRQSFPFDVIHAHNAVPAGEAVRRAARWSRAAAAPLVVSVHGSDVLYTATRDAAGRDAVARGLGAARLVLANSRGIAARARECGARRVEVVHLGADLPADARTRVAVAGARERDRNGDGRLSLVTVGHLVARKRHADVVHALAALRDRFPRLRYVVIGDGPERARLAELAQRLGVADAVELCGQLEPAAALARMGECELFVMPAIDEAFGVAYIEAMAAGLPAVGCRGEPGPEEIARAGAGIALAHRGDVASLAACIEELLSDREELRALGARARETVAGHFTWARCGAQTLAAYETALAGGPPAGEPPRDARVASMRMGA